MLLSWLHHLSHPLHRHDERRPLVVLRVDPVDLGSVGQCLGHVRQAAGTRGPVELQTWAVLLRLIENHFLTGWRRRQCGRHGHGRRLSSFWIMEGKRWDFFFSTFFLKFELRKILYLLILLNYYCILLIYLDFMSFWYIAACYGWKKRTLKF